MFKITYIYNFIVVKNPKNLSVKFIIQYLLT
jgi:hypothetical protein